MELMVTQSYSKNFGLYGERIGALNVVCADADSASKVQSQLGLIVRAMVSNPPLHGAQLVATVIADEALYQQWDSELKMMAQRIVDMRSALVSALKVCILRPCTTLRTSACERTLLCGLQACLRTPAARTL
jgi:aspartate/tyrosine/aromatic aminotransferase